MKVSIIGAGGHVGLPFSLVVANSGHSVTGIDRNEIVCEKLNKGVVPFIEIGAQEILDDFHTRQQTEHNPNLVFTTSTDSIKDAEVITVMIGTPVDSEGNPRLEDIIQFFNDLLVKYDVKDKLIILRSTVSPGTTELIKSKIENWAHLKEGRDFFLVFCPERVTQGHGIEETASLPALIGAFSDTSFLKAKLFFETFVKADIIQLTPKEAELAKLMTNMYRYVNFALANEFMIIADQHKIDANKIIDAANKDYPRLDIPYPGPNVGGPCLYKDGKFLLEQIPFVDLIRTAFEINESMPSYIWNTLKEYGISFGDKVLILGAAFKAGSDDTRNSLSFKLKKILENNGVIVEMYDPLTGHIASSNSYNYDAYVVMTPHKEFSENGTYLNIIRNSPRNSIIVDLWKSTDFIKKFPNGVGIINEIDL